MQSLLVLAPIEPCLTGNGLAIRVASFVEGASGAYEVHVAVLPVAGSLPGCPRRVAAPVAFVRPSGRERVRRRLANLMGDPAWRLMLARAEPMPHVARTASPALAADVVEASQLAPGVPVLVVRSYLAPLGLAVAGRLASPWTSLDLDDDDEELATAQGDTATASAYHRLVATFAPRFSAVSLASPVEAVAVSRRHGFVATTVPNAVEIPPPRPERWLERSGTLLFVGNLGYRPNVEAAELLVEKVLPVLQSLLERRVRVILVGSYPPDGPIARLALHPSVTVVGFVEDLSSYYAQAGVVVAPFSTGGGTRTKLLEAFANQVPVVTTPVGAAGLAVQHMEHLLLAETAESLAAASAAVLCDPNLARRLTASALEFVRRSHSPAVVADQVRSFLSSASGTGDVSRSGPRGRGQQ